MRSYRVPTRRSVNEREEYTPSISDFFVVCVCGSTDVFYFVDFAAHGVFLARQLKTQDQ